MELQKVRILCITNHKVAFRTVFWLVLQIAGLGIGYQGDTQPGLAKIAKIKESKSYQKSPRKQHIEWATD